MTGLSVWFSSCCGPGTNIPNAAAEILSLIRQHRLAA
jgi:hypothetical protein